MWEFHLPMFCPFLLRSDSQCAWNCSQGFTLAHVTTLEQNSSPIPQTRAFKKSWSYNGPLSHSWFKVMIFFSLSIEKKKEDKNSFYFLLVLGLHACVSLLAYRLFNMLDDNTNHSQCFITWKIDKARSWLRIGHSVDVYLVFLNCTSKQIQLSDFKTYQPDFW